MQQILKWRVHKGINCVNLFLSQANLSKIMAEQGIKGRL